MLKHCFNGYKHLPNFVSTKLKLKKDNSNKYLVQGIFQKQTCMRWLESTVNTNTTNKSILTS